MPFSSNGRLSRAPYWLANIGLIVGGLVSGLIAAAIYWHSVAPSTAVGVILLTILVFSTLSWIGFTLAIKRLHDRDKSAWWVLLFYVAPSILEFVENSVDSAGSMPSLIGFGITIWGLIELGCLRGTTGENKYGPDPLQLQRSHS
jgi:uncharacterized membrane protein YhaH (DUF805 family)